MDVRIRRATRKDHDAIWAATMQTVWDDLPPDDRELADRARFESHFRPHARKIVKSPENQIYVAEDSEGRFVGYTIFGPATSMLSAVPFVFVYDVWVSPEARRQGVATALLDHAMAWCRKRGLVSVKLEVAAQNAAARQLYASLDFSEERISLGRSVSGGPENDR
jgi:ribosomal protein S18 acetylase RimI-like enzyme